MAAMHQPVADPDLGQRPAAGIAVVGLIGADRRLVALDQGVGGKAVADIGAGEDGAMDQVGPLICKSIYSI
jgi:hypothetical protein